MLRLLVEAEAGENTRGPRRRAVGIDRSQPVMDLADAMRILGVLGLGKQSCPLGRRGEHGFEGRARASRRFLRDVADAQARRRFDGAVVGLIDPGDQLQQARFAGAVAADQTDAALWRQRGARTIENEVAAKTQRDAIDDEHGRGPYSAAAPRAQTKFCPPIRPVSAVVNAATRKPARLRQKNKIKRDAFTPGPRANDQQGDDQ